MFANKNVLSVMTVTSVMMMIHFFSLLRASTKAMVSITMTSENHKKNTQITTNEMHRK
jgi:hypothetical protein